MAPAAGALRDPVRVATEPRTVAGAPGSADLGQAAVDALFA